MSNYSLHNVIRKVNKNDRAGILAIAIALSVVLVVNIILSITGATP